MLHMAMAHCAEIFTDFYVPHNKYIFFLNKTYVDICGK